MRGLLLVALEHGGGIDDLTAHLGGGAVHDRKAGGVGVRGVDDAAVGGGLTHLRGDLLDIVAVGQLIRDGGLVNAVVVEDLQGVLAHGHVTVADGQHHISPLEQLGKLVKALYALGVALGNGERHLVFQQVHTAVSDDEVKPVGIFLRVADEAAVHRVHLRGSGGDEQVAVCALLDLGEQLAGGIEVVGDGDLGRGGLVKLRDLGQSLRHGGGGEHDQLDRIAGGFFHRGAVPGRGSGGSIGGAVGLGAAGGQREHEGEREEQRYEPFHGLLFPFKIVLYRYPS